MPGRDGGGRGGHGAVAEVVRPGTGPAGWMSVLETCRRVLRRKACFAWFVTHERKDIKRSFELLYFKYHCSGLK